MIIESTLDTKYFLDIVKELDFKDKDEEEARDILHSNDEKAVYQVLVSAPNRWAEHYFIKDTKKENKIVCVITLDLGNNLHYFVTKDLDTKNSIKFVKTIKSLVQETVKYRHTVFVTTRNWYTEAIKFNKLIGFKLLYTHNGKDISSWVYSDRKGY